MRVPYSWLKDFIDLNLSASELAGLLTRSGIEVEEITSLGAQFNGVIVAEVLSVDRHSSADRLFVTRVYDGREEITVVAGIDNMRPGDKVPLATVGASLPNNITIRKTKLRGVESNGMLCSAGELGLEFALDADGILILDSDAVPGTPLAQALQLDDPILVLGLTPNRSDCLGLLGVASEVAGLTGLQVNLPDTKLEYRKPVYDVPKISIADANLCGRYTGLVIRNVKVSPSPLWLQVRLLQAGVRPISNIVDVTNYVMWEWGQPLHAFDYDTLADRAIVVRSAREGETLVTLDKTVRNLSREMLVIADSVRPVGLAGVMGGLETEITDGTGVVLLESASFNPVSIRRTGRALGLYSEAQQRFEKGVDVNGCAQASRRAANLIELLGAGMAEGEVADEYLAPRYPRTITLRPQRARKVIGLEISQNEMASIFRRQGFTVEEGTQLHVTVPTRRADLQEEIDLIEEVARIHGYEKIGTTLPSGAMTQGSRTPRQQVIKHTRNIMVSCGYTEIINYSFITPAHFEKLHLPADDARRRAIRLANPLSEEQSVMRTGLIGGLLETIAYNRNRNRQDLRLFELGAVYLPHELPLVRLPQEKVVLGMAITGAADTVHWLEKERQADFFDLKGALELLLWRIGISGVTYREQSGELWQPGQAAVVEINGAPAGWLGGIHPSVLDSFALDGEVFAAEIDMEQLIGYASLANRYTSLPRYPALLRDLAVVVRNDISAAEVETVIREAGGELVEEVTLFDLYRGQQIPEGQKSLAFAISYRDPARTLSDDNVAVLQRRIQDALAERLGASLRV